MPGKDHKKNVLSEMEWKSLLLVRRGQCRSRAELSRALSISRPTASLLVERLLALHALCEAGYGRNARGKSPTLLVPAPQYQYVIGLDIGYAKQLVGVLLDGRGSIIQKSETAFDNSSLESIRKKSLFLIRKLSAGYPVTGIGVALPGIVERNTGKVLDSINPLLTQWDIGKLFGEWTNLPVMVENRSRSAAFSEAFGGCAVHHNNFLLCSLGRSIGAAFWLNGSVFQGDCGAAGEIRCLRLADGRTLEEALSSDSVLKYSEDELVSICTEALLQLMQVMDLELCILTGRFTDFGARFLKELTKRIAVYRKCRILFSDYGRYSAARGTALNMAEKLVAPKR